MKSNYFLIILMFVFTSCSRVWKFPNAPDQIITEIKDRNFINNTIVFTDIVNPNSTFSVLSFNPFSYKMLLFTGSNNTRELFHLPLNGEFVYSYVDNNITDYLYTFTMNASNEIIEIGKRNLKGHLLDSWKIDPIKAKCCILLENDILVIKGKEAFLKYDFLNKKTSNYFSYKDYVSYFCIDKRKKIIYIVSIKEYEKSKNYNVIADKVTGYDLLTGRKLYEIDEVKDFYYSNIYNQLIYRKLISKKGKEVEQLHIIKSDTQIILNNCKRGLYIPISDDLYFIKDRYETSLSLFPSFRTEIDLYSLKHKKYLRLGDLQSL